jgi:hypothetical protein
MALVYKGKCCANCRHYLSRSMMTRSPDINHVNTVIFGECVRELYICGQPSVGLGDTCKYFDVKEE